VENDLLIFFNSGSICGIKSVVVAEVVITTRNETFLHICQETLTGIALRGPLSQFFSAIYLKPLDEDNTQSSRTSENNGRHWVFCPPDQILLEKMGALVGENVSNLALRRITKPVY
jgi:hypothetical protein